MPRKIHSDNIKLLLQARVLVRPAGVVTAGAVNKNKAQRMSSEARGIYPAGYVNVTGSKYFYHNY
jgi:hypothetical protein